MGEVTSVIRAFSCEACAKFVCNAMHLHSTCLDCCEVEFETTEVEIPDDDSQYSVHVVGCCGARKEKRQIAKSKY